MSGDRQGSQPYQGIWILFRRVCFSLVLSRFTLSALLFNSALRMLDVTDSDRVERLWVPIACAITRGTNVQKTSDRGHVRKAVSSSGSSATRTRYPVNETCDIFASIIEVRGLWRIVIYGMK